MTKTYQTNGVCSRQIDIELDDNNVITACRYTGGCHGNTQGVAALVIGMTAEDAIKRLSGIRCGMRNTSCPDQLARALKEMLGE
ncbi:MAG: TIGR03905 family TSCPD domain-containing protein [Clostridia bacterium]|nr:TIGR03905 family TSCPD domain-containing protein [Clostridia bacterium]MBQ1934965.1 TIGR03905 family TSCPD domain-containing protein [Clostridia bacterium]MBQ5649582.1 TIGR03905 family TSCPD domain-containing protein [Clostridia bacterium]MBQ5809431.1 TIGR03905 family TSCPD domain-containing protein [Clostridia bacterium]MBR0327430.1 TIGR03905 family TSCPD domain-containing protein [Clostridia bacterium]